MNLKNNPELIPLIEWWEKDGKQTVALLAVAAIAVGGWYGWKSHRESVRDAASASLTSSYTADELEEAVSRFSGQPVGGALKIRLAKSYFDAGRYEEALAQYEELSANPPDGFADIPAVGKAQCLEALGKFAEAVEAFDAFAEANPKSLQQLPTDILLRERLALHELLQFLQVLPRIECDTQSLAAVTTRTTRFLIITLQALRNIIMDDKAHIRLVDTHTKSNRRHDDIDAFHHEVILRLATHLSIHTRMIGTGVNLVDA